jgi:hypothetical protein
MAGVTELLLVVTPPGPREVMMLLSRLNHWREIFDTISRAW